MVTRLLCWLFPSLHPCRRGRHTPRRIFRIRLEMVGAQERRCVASFLEVTLACDLCGRVESELWAEVAGPLDLDTVNLSPDQWKTLEAGEKVFLPATNEDGSPIE